MSCNFTILTIDLSHIMEGCEQLNPFNGCSGFRSVEIEPEVTRSEGQRLSQLAKEVSAPVAKGSMLETCTHSNAYF